MNRATKLQFINRLLRVYFNQGTNEECAYELLKDFSNFGPVRLSKIKALYKHFRAEDEIRLRKQNFHTRQLKPYRENAQRHLIYEEILHCDHSNHACMRFNHRFKWNDRFMMDVQSNTGETVHRINVFDSLLNKVWPVVMQRSANQFDWIYALSNELGIVFETSRERHNNFYTYFMSLVRMDVSGGVMEKVQVYRRQFAYPSVQVDSSDSTKFLLRWYNSNWDGPTFFQKCTLVGDNAEFGQTFEIGRSGIIHNYFGGRVYSLQISFGPNGMLLPTKIRISNLEERNSELIEMESLPPKAKFVSLELFGPTAWIYDRLFLPIKFEHTDYFGLVMGDPTTKKWTLIKFAVQIPIVRLKTVNNGDLLIETRDNPPLNAEQSHTFKRHFYKFTFKEPEPLRVLAWRALVGNMKNADHEDPYAEALQWLPLNADIREP